MLCVPAFASSRIGQSGDVRYDEFPGSSPAVLTGEPFTLYPFYISALALILALCRDSFRVTCTIPLVHLLLYIYALVPFHYLSPVVCCLASPASRSACLGSVVYLDLISGYVGRLIHVSSMDNVGEVNNDMLLQLKLRWDNN